MAAGGDGHEWGGWAAFAASVAVGSAAAWTRQSGRFDPPIAARRGGKVRFGRVPSMEEYDDPEENGIGEWMSPVREMEDPFSWIRDDARTNEEVLALLAAENRHTAARMSWSEPLQAQLYKEFIARLKETDAGLPYRDGKFWYYRRTMAGQPYALHCRKPALAGLETPLTPEDIPGEEEVVVDENELGKGRDHFDLGDWEVSPDGQQIAYSTDFQANEIYSVTVRTLGAGGRVLDTWEGTDGSVEWVTNNVVAYVTLDDKHRPNKVYLHRVGRPQSEDRLIFEESNELFWVGISRSRSGRYLFIQARSSDTTVVSVLSTREVDEDGAAVPAITPLAERNVGHMYSASEVGVPAAAGEPPSSAINGFLVASNARGTAPEKQLFWAPADAPTEENWVPLTPPRDDVQITRVSGFSSFALLSGRSQGLPQVWYLSLAAIGADVEAARDGRPADVMSRAVRLAPPSPVYTLGVSGTNLDYEADRIRFTYSSPTQPAQTLELDPTRVPDAWADFRVLHTKPVPNVDPSEYSCARIMVPIPSEARGVAVAGKPVRATHIPVSLIWRREFGTPNIPASFSPQFEAGTPPPAADGGARPTLLYAYGAYGISIDVGFAAARLSVCDRGGVWAVAHIRGGGSMGRWWYESEGKYEAKPNTFLDFTTVARALRTSGVSSRLVSMGASAGGLTVGRSLTLAPELFDGVVGEVPFVDIMATMADPKIPLTITEWKEWGNPHDARLHEVMMGYSPMQTVPTGKVLPPVLLTGGLHDSRVPFWEPVKFGQTIRAADPRNSVLVRIDLTAGHFSASDRYKYLKEDSFIFAFIADKLGIAANPSKLAP